MRYIYIKDFYSIFYFPNHPSPAKGSYGFNVISVFYFVELHVKASSILHPCCMSDINVPKEVYLISHFSPYSYFSRSFTISLNKRTNMCYSQHNMMITNKRKYKTNNLFFKHYTIFLLTVF